MLFFEVLDSKVKIIKKPYINENEEFFKLFKEHIHEHMGLDASIISVLPAYYYTEVVVFYNPYKSKFKLEIPHDKHNCLMATHYPDGLILPDKDLKVYDSIMNNIKSTFDFLLSYEGNKERLYVTNEFTFRFQDVIKEIMYEFWYSNVDTFYKLIEEHFEGINFNYSGTFENLLLTFDDESQFEKVNSDNMIEKLVDKLKHKFNDIDDISLPLDDYIKVVFTHTKK